MREGSNDVPAAVLSGRHRRARGAAVGLRPGAHRETTWAVHARPPGRPRHAHLVARAPRGVGSGIFAAVVAFSLVAGVGAGAAADHAWRDGTALASVTELVRAGGDTVRVTFAAGYEAMQPDRGAGPGTPSTVEPEAPSQEPDEPAELPEPPDDEPEEPAVAEPPPPDFPEGLNAADIAAGVLAPDVLAQGDGDLAVVPGRDDAPSDRATVRTVRIEVEQGLAIDPGLFAGTVMTTLNDPRGWGAEGTGHTGLGFARTDGTGGDQDTADLRVVLATPGTVDEMCAPLTTRSRYSCAISGTAVLNAERWWWATHEYAQMVAGEGADPAEVDRTVYRQYLVNHEVGHLLGQGHVDCPGAGEAAPVMQQQTVQIEPCVPHAWPTHDD